MILVPGYAQNQGETGIRPTVTAPSFALPGLHTSGTYAQYFEAPAYAVVKDETGLKPEEVATFPVVLATSAHAVKGIGEVKAGDKVLVHSGSSGSGSMHIQVAKALGAQVATTIRNERDREFAQSIGADLIINSKKEGFRIQGQGMDWWFGRRCGDR